MSVKTAVQVRLLDNELDALDTYRRGQQNPPSRAQAARELLCRAISSERANGSAAAEAPGVAA
jgi:hypothetical protein